MKKALLWTACILLVLSSILTVAANSTLLALLSLSSLVCGAAMLLVLAFKTADAWPLAAVSIFAGCFQMLYLFSPMEQAKAALAGAVIAGIFCLILPFIVKDLPAKSWLGAALLGKAMFVPEIIMNAFLYQSYALNVYLLFSFAMLIVTSIYAWFGLYLLIKDRTVTLFAGGLCAILEGIFFADIFATIYLLVTDNAARLAGKKMQEEQKQKKPSSFSWNDPKRMRRKKAD